MARKRVPDTSRITRPQTVAYARKDGKSKSDAEPKPDVKDGAPFATLEDKKDMMPEAAAAVPPPVKDVTAAPDASAVKDAAPFATIEAKQDLDEHKPRARQDTVAMPASASVGSPPEVPAAAPTVPARIDAGAVEEPTRMPGPREIPAGAPDDPAPPPGRVPSGDSRSLRKRSDSYEFALIYRLATFVITRFGLVGTRGQWRVVEYPTSGSASHAYAKECSRYMAEGFSDYRD
jgi:hypothetical protein